MSHVKRGDLVALKRGISQDQFPTDAIAIVLREINEVGKTLVLCNSEKMWVYFEDLIVVSQKKA